MNDCARSDSTTTRTSKESHVRIRLRGITSHHAQMYSIEDSIHLLTLLVNLSFSPGLKAGIPRKGF